MTIHETCKCGAIIDVTGSQSTQIFDVSPEVIVMRFHQQHAVCLVGK